MYIANRFDGNEYIKDLVLDSDVTIYVQAYFPKSIDEFERFGAIDGEAHIGVRKIETCELAYFQDDPMYVHSYIDSTKIWKNKTVKVAA